MTSPIAPGVPSACGNSIRRVPRARTPAASTTCAHVTRMSSATRKPAPTTEFPGPSTRATDAAQVTMFRHHAGRCAVPPRWSGRCGVRDAVLGPLPHHPHLHVGPDRALGDYHAGFRGEIDPEFHFELRGIGPAQPFDENPSGLGYRFDDLAQSPGHVMDGIVNPACHDWTVVTVCTLHKDHAP